MVKQQACKMAAILTIMGLMSACTSDSTNGAGANTGPGPFLVVAGLEQLHVLEASAPHAELWSAGLGQAANWMLRQDNRLLVLNSTSHQLGRYDLDADGNWNSLDPLDLGLAEGGNPFAMVPWQDKLLLTELMSSKLLEFDPATGERLREIPTTVSPEELLTDGDRVWVVGSGFDFTTFAFNNGWLYEHDINSGMVQDSLQLGVNPQFIARDPSGLLHVTCTGDYADQPGEIWMIRTDPLALEQRIPVSEGFPGRIAMSSWGKAYVAAGGWSFSGAEAGILLSYDWADGQNLSITDTGLGAVDLIVDEEAGGVWVACMDQASLDWVDRTEGWQNRVQLEEAPQVLYFWEAE